MQKKEKMESTLENIILALANSFQEENREKNKELIAKLFLEFEQNEELYDSRIELAYLNFTDFASMPWRAKYAIKDKKNQCIIDYMYNGIFNHFVRKTIEQKEGNACSGDKESFIVSRVKKALVEGKNLSLYATYDGCEQIDKAKWSKQAYWSPKTFKTTNEVIETFWNWYNVKEN